MKIMHKFGMLAIVAAALLCGTAQATDYAWTNTAGGTYSTSGNWDPAGPPTATDQASFGHGAGSYKVNFGAAAASSVVLVTNQNAVTFNLGGNTYSLTSGTGPKLIVGSNASDNVTLIVSNGTINFDTSLNSKRLLVANSAGSTASLIVNNGGIVNFEKGLFGANSTILVDGAGSKLQNLSGAASSFGGTITVTNGGFFTATNVGFSKFTTNTVTGANSKYTMNQDMLNYGGVLNIFSGGAFGHNAANYAGTFTYGKNSGSGTVNIGDGIGSSLHQSTGFTVGDADEGRAAMTFNVNSGGILRTTAITGNGPVYYKSTVSLNGGVIEVGTNSTMWLPDGTKGNSIRPLLRGVGTIQRVTGTTGNGRFTVKSDGDIRPGDTNSTAAIGTLTISNGDLTQSSTVGTTGTIYFTFNATTNDQIAISGGTATIAGKLVFTNEPSFTPTKGMGKTWDFVRADSISYTASHNMAALLTPYGLATDVNYTFGVVDDGGGKVLRLEIPNHAPTATAQPAVTTVKNTPKAIVLAGSDADGDALTYEVVAGPINGGTLSSITEGTNITFTPLTDYTGPDSFTFKVYDGVTYSAPATVTITVAAFISNLAITNQPGTTNITLTGATFQGTLIATDAVATAVYAFYGATDGGSNKTGAGCWDSSELVNANAITGLVTYAPSPLTTGYMYYYRFLASNDYGEVWASPVQSFLAGAVSVVASDPSVSEGGSDTGTFTISRAATATNGALTVNYAIAGTATPGSDYTSLGSQVTLAAGVASTNLTVTGLKDSDYAESVETVILTLQPGLYVIGSASATVTITNADYTWNNPAGGVFSNNANWRGNVAPTATDPATFGLGAGSYTVNFGGAAASSVVLVTNQNAVTFDLGGYTYTANNGGQELCVGSNATDNVKFTITRGRFSSSGGGTIVVGANNSTATLQVDDSGGSAGSVVLGGSAADRPLTVGANGTLIVSGPGSYVGDAAYAINAQAGSLIVLTNGGALSIANMDSWGALIGTLIVDGAGSVLTNYSNVLRMLSSGAGMATVRNGGRMQNAGKYELGVSSGSGKFVIGNGSAATSVVQGTSLLFGTDFDPGRGSPEVTINAAGLFRATATANSVFIYDLGTLTMNDGIVELTATGQVIVADINSTGAKGLLRGSGTFTRYTGTYPFSMLNQGTIRPGDTNTTPTIGTLTVHNGNLTNAVNGTIYFDFNATTGDQIAISGGTATIAGTLTFTNAPGFTPVKNMGKSWDFVRANSIGYTGTDNVTNLMTAYGLTAGVHYTFGVVTDGAVQALRLKINGPSGTIVLIK